MITIEEILMDRIKFEDLSEPLQKNIISLNAALNQFRGKYNKPMIVTSGYRTSSINYKANGAKNSPHLTCQACDFQDKDGSLARYCLDNLELLADCGLYMENPEFTKGWVHLQIRPTKSGNRVFNP